MTNANAPKPPEAPVECEHPLSAIRNLPTRHCLLCGKPAPAPEPKQGSEDHYLSPEQARNKIRQMQGSEEPPPLTTPATPGGPAIDWKRADKWAIEYEDDWAPGATPNAARAYLALRAEVEKLQAQNASLQDTIDAHVGTDSMCRIGHERIRFEQGDTPPDVLACPMCNLRAQLEKAEARVREGADLLDRASRYCPNAAFLIEEIERYIRAARKGESR